MKITDEMVEKAAREICKYEGISPDHPIHYEEGLSGTHYRRDPIREEYVGTRSSQGSIIEQYPTMPYWKFRYETFARRILEAAIGDSNEQI